MAKATWTKTTPLETLRENVLRQIKEKGKAEVVPYSAAFSLAKDVLQPGECLCWETVIHAKFVAVAADFESELLSIQHAWDSASYASPDTDTKKRGLEALSERVRAFATANPNRAEALVWQGIVLSSYAGAKGGFGALSLAKQARDSLLAAVKIDPDALHGSAYTSLGALYYKVPRFPIGFGDHDAAAEYLKKALA